MKLLEAFQQLLEDSGYNTTFLTPDDMKSVGLPLQVDFADVQDVYEKFSPYYISRVKKGEQGLVYLFKGGKLIGCMEKKGDERSVNMAFGMPEPNSPDYEKSRLDKFMKHNKAKEDESPYDLIDGCEFYDMHNHPMAGNVPEDKILGLLDQGWMPPKGAPDNVKKGFRYVLDVLRQLIMPSSADIHGQQLRQGMKETLGLTHKGSFIITKISAARYGAGGKPDIYLKYPGYANYFKGVNVVNAGEDAEEVEDDIPEKMFPNVRKLLERLREFNLDGRLAVLGYPSEVKGGVLHPFTIAVKIDNVDDIMADIEKVARREEIRTVMIIGTDFSDRAINKDDSKLIEKIAKIIREEQKYGVFYIGKEETLEDMLGDAGIITFSQALIVPGNYLLYEDEDPAQVKIMPSVQK